MNINQFLSLKEQFSLGHLSTEGFHPLSKNLSSEAKNNLNLAIEHFKQIDHEAIIKMQSHLTAIYQMALDIHLNLAKGKKVFLVGCGATGRLSLTLERIFTADFSNQIIALMAGGDYALIKSVESFEDEISYGPRQLLDCGYSPGDLVIGVTEAGETSFVIGSVNHAAKIESPSPWIFFCNDESSLMKIDRCQNYITNSKIKKLSINVGPMALSGSTRLQASSIQMLALGLAFEYGRSSETEFIQQSNIFLKKLLNLNYAPLSSLIKTEANLYSLGQNFTYICEEEYAISILTDTTERSPTFNLAPFENDSTMPLARCYLAIKGCKNSREAWTQMLGRLPRAVIWSELNGRIDLDQILAFDISENAINRRGATAFNIEVQASKLHFQLEGSDVNIKLDNSSVLFRHLALKLLLNCHSTLVMGRVDRYQNNIMTWVKPSNLKLIDRATRYAIEILRHNNISADYDEVASKIIAESHLRDESIVLKVVAQMIKR